MKRIYSLKGRNLFKEVYNRGTRFQEKGIRIIILKCDEDFKSNLREKKLSNKEIKIGISLNKKIGKAIIRNKERRRIKAICHELLKEMNNGFYIIIRLEQNFKNISFNRKKAVIRSLFFKAGVIK